MGRNRKNHRAVRWTAVISIWTFVLAVVLGLITHFLVNAVYSMIISFLILLAVILLGIVFDVIGTAAAAAGIAPLNAKAACRVFGAKRSVYLVQNADRVANFCNDVVGDISGIISGTLITVIILRLVLPFSFERMEMYTGILLTALVAALTVGGKAWGKNVAISHATEVMLLAGKILTHLEGPVSWFTRVKRNGSG